MHGGQAALHCLSRTLPNRYFESSELAQAEVRSAYRKLAVKWHPDKHPNNQQEAKAKFQEVQRF